MNDPFWSVRVPVSFELRHGGEKADEYGTWQAYVPGPHTKAPWTEADEARQSPDSLVADGSTYP